MQRAKNSCEREVYFDPFDFVLVSSLTGLQWLVQGKKRQIVKKRNREDERCRFARSTIGAERKADVECGYKNWYYSHTFWFA